MSYVKAENLTKGFGSRPRTTVVDGLDLTLEEGEFLVLLGPSGCGKTTTLRCLAGLEAPDAGSISLGGRRVFDAAGRVDLPPDKRSIGMVFQSYALWPHMTVRANIAYPLRARGLKHRIKEGWAEETAGLVGCEELLDRYPAQLSGGQQQRVALARGLVARPDLMLFDEPLSNLDARLRDSVRAYLHGLHARLRFTAVFVTHDQSEAFALGDRLAVMNSGRLEQVDTPQQVFENPATEYVADFIGMSNRLLLTRSSDGWCLGDQSLAGPSLEQPGSEVVARLRAEDVHVGRQGSAPVEGALHFAATVTDVEYGGRHLDVALAVGPSRLQARVPLLGHDGWVRSLATGDAVSAGFRGADACFYSETVAGPTAGAALSEPVGV